MTSRYKVIAYVASGVLLYLKTDDPKDALWTFETAQQTYPEAVVDLWDRDELVRSSDTTDELIELWQHDTHSATNANA